MNMDASERVEEYTEEQEIIESQELPVSQPKVIVERMDEIIEETVMEEEDYVEETGPAETQNGGGGGGAAATLDDIIADAVGPDNDSAETPAKDTDVQSQEEGTAEDKDGEAESAKEETTPSRRKQESTLELNQCRCCTSRDDLVDIFEPIKGETGLPISTVLVKLCTGITVTKRDHLPNVICRSCIYKAQIAWEFRELVQKTDAELRESLPRAKKVVRKRTDYTLIDYESSSGDDAGQNVDDEDEFKLSDEISDGTEPSDSDTEYGEVKKRGRPKKKTPSAAPAVTPSPSYSGKPRGRPRKDAAVAQSSTTTPRGRGRPPGIRVKPEVKSEEEEEEEEEEEVDSDEPKPKKPATASKAVKCPKCKSFYFGVGHVCRAAASVSVSPKTPAIINKPGLTIKPSSGAATFSCSFCAEKFTTHPLYMNHQQLHANFQNANTCVRCHRQYSTKAELRTHQAGVRCHKALTNKCLVCQKMLANASQLAIHLRNRCGAGPVGQSPGMGPRKTFIGGPKKAPPVVVVKKEKKEDPFKDIGPNASTYWGDSDSD